MTPDKKRNFGIKLDELIEDDPELVERVRTHLGDEYLDLTAGQAQHYDAFYGGADPRVEAGNKHTGDSTAAGGSGPKRR